MLIMQSNGGVMTSRRARRRPVHVIESGPAAGVIATAALARRIGAPNAISVDMGGTTAKASVIEDYEIKRSGEFEIGGTISQGSRLNKGGGFLLRTPAIDIAEVGRGRRQHRPRGRRRRAACRPAKRRGRPGPGLLRPGRHEATLTDANVTLGYLRNERLPSGLALSAEQARQRDRRAGCAAVAGSPSTKRRTASTWSAAPGWPGPSARSRSNAAATRATSPSSPSAATGRCFAAEMARSLEIGTVLVPPAPGVFSAVGLLEADLEHHSSGRSCARSTGARRTATGTTRSRRWTRTPEG